jgi:hypothetical protein
MDTHWSLDNYEDPPSAELACDEILASLRTTFGKLVALASMRVKDTGEYLSAELAKAFGPDVITRTLGSRHERIFREWLALSMEQQHKDLSEFLASDMDENSPPPTLADLSILIPPLASAPERTLFFDDLAFVLALMDRS